MDLNDHLKKLEAFSRKLSGEYQGASGRLGPWAGDQGQAPAWYLQGQRAVEFLQRAGAAPEVVEIKDGPKGAPQGLKLKSFDADGLKKHLAGLGSARAIAQWIEEGVQLGAVAVRGERMFFTIDGGHDRGALGGGSGSERGVEATGPIVEAAHSAMVAETASTLDLLDRAEGSGGGDVLQFREDTPMKSRRVVATDSSGDSSRLGGLKSTSDRVRTVAGGEEIGAKPRFVVTGDPIKLRDGMYYPVEAVDAHSRGVLKRAGATGMKVGKSGGQTLVRADQTESLRATPEAGQPEEAAPEDRNNRIQLAYRLLHGLTLDSSQGAPIDAGLASRVERFFGESFGDVKVHTGRIASEITEALSVEALSMGTHVVIPEHLLRSASGEGERVMIHELTHVRQHRRGGEEPRSMRELEADTVVNRFVSGKGRPLMDVAEMPTRAPAPPPETAGSMPRAVYASAVGQASGAPGGAKGGGNLRSEKSVRRITQEVTRRNRKALEDLLDRQG